MGTRCAFLVGSFSQLPHQRNSLSNACISSAPTYKLEGHVVASGEWIQIHVPEIVDATFVALRNDADPAKVRRQP